MTGWPLVVVVAVLAVGFVGYLSMTAGRLDHLHRRIELARSTLDAHLLRRSSESAELAGSGLLDPATSLILAASAHDAARPDLVDADRMQAESDLTAALLVALDPEDAAEVRAHPDGARLIADLEAAGLRVRLSRRFHNDAVRACRQVRRRRLVRLFRLAGHTPLPDPWEMDDRSPFDEQTPGRP